MKTILNAGAYAYANEQLGPCFYVLVRILCCSVLKLY